MKQTNIFITILLVIFAFGNVNCSNYAYSITSNTNPADGQILWIYDVANTAITFNVTIITEYIIKGIMNVDYQNDQVIFLGYSENQNENLMLQFNTATSDLVVLSTVDIGEFGPITQAPQPPLFVGKSYCQVGEINNDVTPSYNVFDFTTELASSQVLSLPNFYSDPTQPSLPFIAYSGINDTMFVVYQSKDANSNASVASFKSSQPNQIDSYTYNINGLNYIDIVSIFTSPSGGLYAVVALDEAYFNIGICQIDLQTGQCVLVSLSSGGVNYSSQRYVPTFLSNDGSKVFLIGTYSSSWTTFFMFDTTTFGSNIFYLPNQWTSQSTNLFSYFSYL